MLLARLVISVFLFAAIAFGTGVASGQAYPTKPIRIISPGPGGDPDFAARLLAQAMSGPLGQQIIVENRPSGVIPGQVVSKAPADGYTILIAGTSLWIGPFLEDAPYDPEADFLPITLLTRSPNILYVHPSLPVKSVKELIALAKAKPGELNYGSGGTGTSTHLSPEFFKHMAGVNIVRVRYNSGSQRVNALLGGEVQVQFESAAVLAHVKTGKLRALAVTSPEPSLLAPGLPTIAATGVPGYAWEGMMGMFAPAKTPAPIITRLNQEFVRALNNADVKPRFFSAGEDVVGSSPEQFAATLKSEMARLGKLIKDAGLREAK